MNLITNSIVQVLANFVLRGISLGLIILLSRILGVQEMGIYYFSFSFLGFLMIFTDLGLSSFFVRGIAANKEKSLEQLNTLLTLKFLLALIFLITSIGIITFFQGHCMSRL